MKSKENWSYVITYDFSKSHNLIDECVRYTSTETFYLIDSFLKNNATGKWEIKNHSVYLETSHDALNIRLCFYDFISSIESLSCR